MIAVGSNKMTFDLFKEVCGLRWSDDFRGAMFIPDHLQGAVAKKEHVIAAYGWSGFIGRTCNISILIQQPALFSRQIIREAFRYPFEVCGLNAVIATVDSTNTGSLSVCDRTGFEKVCTIKDGGAKGDLVVYEMHRERCRWLRKEEK